MIMRQPHPVATSPKAIFSRRDVLATAAALPLAAAVAAPYVAKAQAAPITLTPLPYAESALAPVISANTIGFHYGKHHAGYVMALNKALETDDLKSQPLAEIIKTSALNPNKAAIFNAAAQTWNHDFYWKSLNPKGGGKASGKLAEMIDKSFGDFEKCKAALAAAALGQFGSGWAWLCREGDKLTIRRTANADTPLYVQGVTPLLTIDVWEHAYYLDYQNRRADYVAALMDKLINWNFAAENLG